MLSPITDSKYENIRNCKKSNVYLFFTDFVPARFNVALMMFLACWVNYMLRVNMSVNIIAMVPDESTTTS